MNEKKTALITGANRGLGLETARQMAAEGYAVILSARDLEKGEAAAQSLRDSGADAHAVQLEVADEQSVERAAREVGEKFGHIDALINNAGVNFEYDNGSMVAPSKLSLKDLRQTYDTNVFGAFSVLRAFLPLLQKSKAPRVVNVSSMNGSLTQTTNPDWFAYGFNTVAYNSSKSALNALTVSFAKEFHNTPMKINAACPGWVKTDMGTDAAPRALEEGPRIFVKLATLPDDGPTGGFFNEDGVIAW